jgi:hypothetical protein
MEGEECPWPWEPQQLAGAPMGQYHCGYCGEMCIAGMEHTDYRGVDWGDLFGVEPTTFTPPADDEDPWAVKE